MTSAERFLEQAAECERMSRFSQDAGSKAVWRGMAERWRHCADLSRRQAVQRPPKRSVHRTAPAEAGLH